MKRVLPVIASCMVLYACSWITDFFVANKSGKPIEITYRYKQYEHSRTHVTTCIFEQSDEVPVMSAIAELQSQPCGNWRVLQPNEYNYDKDKCEIRVTLPPGQAVRVGRMGTYTGNAEGRLNNFQLGMLTLRTPGGLIQYEGLELLKAFKKKSDTLYILYYSDISNAI